MVYAHIRIIGLHVGGGAIYGDVAGIAAGGVPCNFADGVAAGFEAIVLCFMVDLVVYAVNLYHVISQDARQVVLSRRFWLGGAGVRKGRTT